jgi:hypothetical protein
MGSLDHGHEFIVCQHVIDLADLAQRLFGAEDILDA